MKVLLDPSCCDAQEAKALNGKVLLALPPQFAAVLFAAYLMNLEDFFMSEAVTKLGTIFDRSDPHQLFGHHASQVSSLRALESDHKPL